MLFRSAFDARPPGFDRQSGPATGDDRGKPVFLSPAALSVRLETSRATWDRARGQGVSRTPSTVRATLTGGAATSLTWQVEAQQGSSWVVVETLPLEP